MGLVALYVRRPLYDSGCIRTPRPSIVAAAGTSSVSVKPVQGDFATHPPETGHYQISVGRHPHDPHSAKPQTHAEAAPFLELYDLTGVALRCGLNTRAGQRNFQ